MPLYGGVMIFCTMASLGLPTLIGFVGEFLAFLGAFPIYQTAAVVSAFGLILAAAYWLWMLQRLLYGPTNPDYVGLPDMAGREKLAIFPLMAIILVLGLWPRLILDMINTADVNLFTDQRSILSRRFSPSPLSMRVSQTGFQRPHKTTT